MDLAALRVQLAVTKHEIARRKAQGLSPLTEADAGWQIVLRNLARYQDACREEYGTEEEWIAGTVDYFDDKTRQTLKRFLDTLLNGGYSDAVLEEVWSFTAPTYNFRPGGHRIFLTRVRDMIM